jgi:hypothetical protein
MHQLCYRVPWHRQRRHQFTFHRIWSDDGSTTRGIFTGFVLRSASQRAEVLLSDQQVHRPTTQCPVHRRLWRCVDRWIVFNEQLRRHCWQ